MTFLDRVFRRAEKRHYEAARPAAHGLGHFPSGINGAIAAGGATVRSRARFAAANNPLIANGVANWATAIGCPRPTHADAGAVDTWAARERRTTFAATVRTMTRALIVDGEALAILRPNGDLRPLAIEQLSDESRPLGDGREIVNGVELDADGDPIAYWIFPGRHESGDWRPAVRVDAADVLHLFRQDAPGQVRGVSWLAPAILPASDLDQLQDALVTRAKVAAMLMGFIKSMEGAPLDLAAELPSLEPGTMARLGAGEDATFNNPTPSAENGALIAVQVRRIAAGLGIPAHLVDGDLSGANYSSLRAGLLPFRASVEAIQYSVIAPALDRVWARVTLASPCEWLFPAFMQVDPGKQVAADVSELKAGLTSRRKLVAARGWDLAELDAELAAEGWKPESEDSA